MLLSRQGKQAAHAYQFQLALKKISAYSSHEKGTK
jgi:hypothetical protein